MAKYIIDIDALISCLDLLSKPAKFSDGSCTVYLNDVKELLNRFPKEEYGKGYVDKIPAYRDLGE